MGCWPSVVNPQYLLIEAIQEFLVFTNDVISGLRSNTEGWWRSVSHQEKSLRLSQSYFQDHHRSILFDAQCRVCMNNTQMFIYADILGVFIELFRQTRHCASNTMLRWWSWKKLRDRQWLFLMTDGSPVTLGIWSQTGNNIIGEN